MTRLALILAAIFAVGSPLFAQQSPNSKLSQPFRTQLLVQPPAPLRVRPLPPLRARPLPPLRWPSKTFAEPIPSWNIHGYAEEIPNLHAEPLKTRSWRYRPPSPATPSLPHVETATSTATHPSPQAVNSSGR